MNIRLASLRLLCASALTLLCSAILCPAQTPQQSQTSQQQSSTCNVRDFGATGNGATLDTSAIASAIRACASRGGGTVLFPPGTYLTGTFELQSNITLHLEAGAIILGSRNVADYGTSKQFGLGHTYAVDSSGEGDRVGIIFARNVHDVAITGRGVIDGNGDAFMDFSSPHASLDFDPQQTRDPQRFTAAVHNLSYGPVEPKQHGAGRPGTMLIFLDSRNIHVRDVTFRAAPNWTFHMQGVQQAVISGLHIDNNPLIPNNDGIDCMRCSHVHISDCDIRAGDDDFAIVDSDNITVTNCSLQSRSAAIRLEATRLSTFDNLTIDTNRGIGIFHRGDSRNSTEDVLFSNIVMRTHLIPGHWWGKAEPIYIAVRPCAGANCTSGVRNVTLSNITATAESGALILGARDSRIENITLDGVRLRIQSPPADIAAAFGGNFDLRWTASDLRSAIVKHDTPGLYCRWVDRLRIRDLQLTWADNVPDYFSNGVQCEDFGELAIEHFSGTAAPGKAPAVLLSNGAQAIVPSDLNPADVRTSNVARVSATGTPSH